MAVVLPGKFIFLATPYTGSSAVTEALKKIPDAFVPQKKQKGIGQFATLEEVQQIAGDKLKGGEVVFAFVRNPYDMFVTWYLRMFGKYQMSKLETTLRREPTLLDFMRLWHDGQPLPYYREDQIFYQAKDAHVVLRYERGLTKEVNSLMRKLPNVPSVEIGTASVTPDKDHWSTYYDQETYAFVNEAFKADFVAQGYQFLWG